MDTGIEVSENRHTSGAAAARACMRSCLDTWDIEIYDSTMSSKILNHEDVQEQRLFDQEVGPDELDF